MLSPKEFIDNTCSSTGCTETFAAFSEYTGKGLSLRNSLARIRSNNYEFRPVCDSYFDSYSPLRLGKPFERICPGQIVINSGDGYSFNDDAEKYRQIYKNPFLCG